MCGVRVAPGVFCRKIILLPVETVALLEGFKFTPKFVMQKALPEFGRAFLFLNVCVPKTVIIEKMNHKYLSNILSILR